MHLTRLLSPLTLVATVVFLGAGCAAHSPGVASRDAYDNDDRGPIYYGGGYFGNNYPGRRYIDGPPIHPEMATTTTTTTGQQRQRRTDAGY